MIKFSGTLTRNEFSFDVFGQYTEYARNGFLGWNGWMKGKGIELGNYTLTLEDGDTGIVTVTGLQCTDGEQVFMFKTQGPTPR